MPGKADIMYNIYICIAYTYIITKNTYIHMYRFIYVHPQIEG